jgi:hypothetical protein
MCSSVETSIAVFGLSMIVSYMIADAYRKVPIILSICLAWQPVVLMSFFDALVLKELRDEEGSTVGIYTSIFTFLLQPSLMSILLLVRKDIPSNRRLLASIIIIAHIYWYTYSLVQVTSLSTIEAKAFPYSEFMYFFTTVYLFLLLIPHVGVALILIACTISYYLTSGNECEECIVSMSDLISISTPVVVALYWEKYHTAPEVSIFSPRIL